MKRIELHDYRCFESLAIKFREGVNLLVGDNASGKTTLLQAIRSALSAFFSGYSDENTRFIGLSKKDFTRTESGDMLVNERPVWICFDYSDYLDGNERERERIGCLALMNKKSRTVTNKMKEYKGYAKELQEHLFDQKTQVKPLPLFASFSTGDIHYTRKLSATPFVKYLHKPSFGYYECLQGDGLFSYWMKRLLVLVEGGKGSNEVTGVTEAVANALGEQGCNIISGMSIRPNVKNVFYSLADGREVEAEDLSDGYRRLVSIVTDIAFRCMLLNQGIYGKEACKKTHGTVLIDEIDLHLHPTLQACVVRSFRKAFPNLQFIISTHAPMVMTSVKTNKTDCVYRMEYHPEKGYRQTLIDTYGLDASTIIETKLDFPPRAIEVEDQLKKLFDSIDEEQYSEAKKLLRELQSQFESNLPELARAETMLDFMSAE